MTGKTKLPASLKSIIKSYFAEGKRNFIPGKTKIPLQIPTYGSEEVLEALESMLSRNVTMGKKVEVFERKFATYLGSQYATMVNSGSSANLIALSTLSNQLLRGHIPNGAEIITPATTWATTIYPISNINCIPVVVDVDIDTFDINVDSIEKAITKKTKAIMPVHLLGNPCDMNSIMELAEKHNLFVIEDACEAPGAKIGNKKVGTFGDIGTFSFFFSHHISTIEGGMTVTNNEDYEELSKIIRVFGWARNSRHIEEYARRYKDVDKRFLFVNLGYNFRPTEIHGAFGMHQIDKLERMIEIRRRNAEYWNKRFEGYSEYISTQKERPQTRHVWFGYPITVMQDAPFSARQMMEYLESKGIETRPIQVPNIAMQPSFNLFKHRIAGPLKNANYIASHSFWFGNNHGISKTEREFVADEVVSFIRSKTK